jgi:hypothetical protein
VDHQSYPAAPGAPLPPAPSFAPPAPGPQWTGPQWNGKTNGFSIAALTFALLGCTGVISIAFGFIGLSQSRRNGDKRGKVYAILALSICGLWLAAIAVFVGIAIARDVADGPDRDNTGAIRGERSITLTALRPGDCVKDLKSQTGRYVDVAPCSVPHNGEVFATFDLPAGAADAQKAAERGCEQRFEAYAGRKPPKDAKLLLFTARLEELGETGDPGVLCFALRPTGTATGSLKR